MAKKISLGYVGLIVLLLTACAPSAIPTVTQVLMATVVAQPAMPSPTVALSATSLKATATAIPTSTAAPIPTRTPAPTATSVPNPTEMPAPTATQPAEAPATPIPTALPVAPTSPASPASTAPQPTAVPPPTAAPTATTAPVATYAASAWVSVPNPSQRSNNTVFGKLTGGGVGIAGAEMYAVAYYKSTKTRVPASGTIRTGADGIAAAVFNVGGASSGFAVRVDVFLAYQGQTYQAATSFTPK